MTKVVVISNMHHPLLKPTFSSNYNIEIYLPINIRSRGLSFIINSMFYIKIVSCCLFRYRGEGVIFNFHYPNVRFLIPIIIINIFGGCIKISIWGSDYFKALGLKYKILIWILHCSKSISVSSSSMLKKLDNLPSDLLKKIVVTPFCIPNIKDYASVLKREYSSANENIVLCGTNGSDNQQFDFITSAISALPGPSLTRASFVFHFGYGGDKEVEIRSALPGFKNFTIDKLMYSGSALINFRAKFDILIQIQKSDQLSAAMLEHLALGCIVITGKWLPYDFLEEAGIFFIRIDRPESLQEALEGVLNNISYYLEQSKSNRSLIALLFSELESEKKWNSFLMS